jgi:hypothetical protein
MQPLAEEIIARRVSLDGAADQGHPSASTLERLHRELLSRWPEWAALSAFAALVAWAIPAHAPGADEAQAWQLARTLSLPSLFQTYIRYEGTPGLWHFLLWIMNRAHVSYSGLHWICGAIAVASTALLMLSSPFPRYLKLLLPFTCFLLFQYAVVARSYVLVPLLLFGIASRWKNSPMGIALLLGLLANLSLHAAVISGGLAIVYALEQIRGGCLKRPAWLRQLVASTILLLALYGFALWTAWPPHDLQQHVAYLRKDSGSLITNAIGSIVLGICQPWLLAIPFWFAIALCLHRRRSLFYLLPILFFALFCGVVRPNWWHVGLPIPVLICVLWITWPNPEFRVSRIEHSARAAFALVCGMQILWAGHALIYDHSNPYSPDAATAEFLKPFVSEGATIAVTYVNDPGIHAFISVGLLPYFDHNIFANLPYPFWWWSDNNPSEEQFNALLPTHPRIVIAEYRPPHAGEAPDLTQPKFQFLVKSGYRLSNVFCGSMPRFMELDMTVCHLVYQYSGPPASAPANSNHMSLMTAPAQDRWPLSSRHDNLFPGEWQGGRDS